MRNEENKDSRSFYSKMKAELKKVVWPTKKQTAKSTAVTIGFVLLISAILIVLNLGYEFIFDKYNQIFFGESEVYDYSQLISNSGDTSGENVELSGDVSTETLSGDETLNSEVE